MKGFCSRVLAGGALAALALPALAHPGHDVGHLSALASGFTHPFTGLDHLLAMVTVGFAAAQMRRAIVPLALAFVGFMVIGGVMGAASVAVPHVETGIALSVLILGVVLAAAKYVPVWAGAALVALFAVFHGHAHGAEMAHGTNALLYFASFAAGTLTLHLAGYGAGRWLLEKSVAWWPQLAGASVAGAGALLLIGQI